MRQNTKCFLPIRHVVSSIQGTGPATAIIRTFCCNLLLSGIALLFSMALSPVTWASVQPDTGIYENLDTRWLPWIGSWSLVSNAVNTSESEQYTLTISPGDNEKSITMKSYKGEMVLSEEKIIADGLRHPLTGDKCTGWYSYSWSETGKRLLLNSESSCSGNLSHLISGMSIIDDTGNWLDIQLLQNGKEKAVAIRKYRNIDNASVISDRVNAANAILVRVSAGANFSISEIIELSSKVEPEVLEAALLELHKPFPIDSQQIVRLADSKVPSQIVDLMVALSFPDKFKIERATISPVQKPMAEMGYPVVVDDCWDYGYPLFPWYWGSSSYSPCDYWDLGWNEWPGWYYGYWGRPNYGGGDYGIDTGRLVEGHGYTRVSPGNSGSTPRYARPRNAPERQEEVSQPASSSYSGMSTSESSSGSSTSSRTKTPCASPNGYSSGNCD